MVQRNRPQDAALAVLLHAQRMIHVKQRELVAGTPVCQADRSAGAAQKPAGNGRSRVGAYRDTWSAATDVVRMAWTSSSTSASVVSKAAIHRVTLSPWPASSQT